MDHYTYDRLSLQDNDFLIWESPTLPMHLIGLQIFRAGSLRTTDGGIDFESIKRLTESLLHRIPRYRQKLMWIPGEQQAVWVDDEHFNPDYHLKHTSVPRPGTDQQLKRLVARIMEHPLDRSRPLWEYWVVEGLERDRFAVIGKMHHCMVDGESGLSLIQILLSRSRERQILDSPRFIPRPVPTSMQLRRDALLERLTDPIRAVGRVREAVERARELPGEITSRLRSLEELVRWKAIAASETPLNGPIGPHRRIDWTTTSLAEVKEVKKALGCTVNDVVLATVTGAVRSYMKRRGVPVDTLDFRVSTPVNVRTRKERDLVGSRLGNRVSGWVVPLPLAEADPVKQVEAIHQDTEGLKHSRQAAAVEMLTAVIERLPFDVAALASGTYNAIVSNFAGPQYPLYLLGAEALGLYPLGPLMKNAGLTISVLSYDGKMCWGFNADYDRAPDLEAFVEDLGTAFERLGNAVGVKVRAAFEPEPEPPAVEVEPESEPPAVEPEPEDVSGPA